MRITAPLELDLDALVRGVAADPAQWRPLVHHDAEQRHFALLRRDVDVELWVVSWMAGHDTGFHDHDDSAAAIIVADGAVRDHRLAVGTANPERDYTAGECFVVPPSAIHRVVHAGAAPSVTIHAYSPPLRRMGQYEVGPDGTLQRHASAAEDELKPIAA